jgi:CubicO group peptidase (beta-lactamase class C family)
MAEPMDFAPGRGYSYSNSGYFLLGTVVELVSGQDYESFLRETFLEPFGMDDTGVRISNSELATGYPSGNVFQRDVLLPFDYSNTLGNGSLYSTVGDLYIWAQALDRWEADPESEFQGMFVPHTQTDSEDWRYGYGENIGRRFGQTVVGHTGRVPGFSSLLTRYPESGLTVIVLSNNEAMDPAATGIEMARIALGLR